MPPPSPSPADPPDLARARRLGHRPPTPFTDPEATLRRRFIQREPGRWLDTETGKVYVAVAKGPRLEGTVGTLWLKAVDPPGGRVLIRYRNALGVWEKLSTEEKVALFQAYEEETGTPQTGSKAKTKSSKRKQPMSAPKKGQSKSRSTSRSRSKGKRARTAKTLEPVESAKKGLRAEGLSTSKLTSTYTAQVELIPLEEGTRTEHAWLGKLTSEQRYAPTQVWVTSIRVSDQDRPDTRFGKAQKSHTVAWALIRRSLMALAPGTAADVLSYFDTAFAALKPVLENREGLMLLQAAHGSQILTSLRQGALLPMDRWSWLLGELVKLYAMTYQLSEAATYDDGESKGHGEGWAVRRLEKDERYLLGERGSNLKKRSVKTMSQDVVKLLDVQAKSTLSAAGFAFSVHHWIDSLSLRFPTLMEKYGSALVQPLLARELPKKYHGASTVAELLAAFDHGTHVTGLSATGLEVSTGTALALPSAGKLDSPFVASLTLEPVEKGTVEAQTVTVGDEKRSVPVDTYSAQQLRVRAVALGDRDRPKTKFGNRQKSHTVAWTLVRHQVKSFEGESAGELLSFLGASFDDLRREVKHKDGRSLITGARRLLAAHGAARLTLPQWKRLVSELVRLHFIAYQVSESATYANPDEPRPKGHGEASHMQALRRNEFSLQSTDALADSPQRIVRAAVTLVDANITKTLSRKQLKSVYKHWHQAMARGFPTVMKRLGTRIEAALLRRKVKVFKGGQEEARMSFSAAIGKPIPKT